MFVYAVYLAGFGVLLPHIGAAFAAGPAAQARLFPANFCGFTAGVLAGGFLSDRLGRKLVLACGLAAYAAGLFAFASAHVFAEALLASAAIGAANGVMESGVSALAVDLFPERRAFILAAIQVGFGAGAMVGPSVAQALIRAGATWRGLLAGFAAVNGALFALFVVERFPAAHGGYEAIDLPVLRSIALRPAFRALCLAQALYVGAEVGFFSWMPSFFGHSMRGGAAWAGAVVTLFWLGMTAGRLAVVRAVGRYRLAALCCALAAGGAVAAAGTLACGGRIPAVACIIAAGLCFSGIFSLILTEAGERYPEAAGSVFGAVIASGGLGGAAVPWLVGALQPALGWRMALAVVPLCLFGIVAIMRIIGAPLPAADAHGAAAA